MKTSNNKYLCSERDNANHILGNRTEASGWEAFNLILLDGDKIALQSDDGKYVSALLDQGGVLVHTVDKMQGWEIFEMVKVGGDRFALKCANNKFVALNGDMLYGNSDNAEQAEHFTIVQK